ncbi:hypothetical protein XENORESO_000644, partial [Xenotaenia resolanae]
LKKGPPVPPPPKVTPTKEVAEEQIIDLFGGEFLPAPSPSQPNERPGESLLDLDFDAFQPDDSVSPIPQTAVPWDMWSANSQPAQPAADAGFAADWSADFGSMSANGDVASAAVPIASEMPEGQQVGVQGGAQCWPQAESSPPGGDTTSVQDSEPRRKEDEVEPDSENMGKENRRKSTPGLIFTNEFGDEIEDGTGDEGDKRSRSLDGSVSEYETAEEWADGGQGGGWVSADDELSYAYRLPVEKVENKGVEMEKVGGIQTLLPTAIQQPPQELKIHCPAPWCLTAMDSSPLSFNQTTSVELQQSKIEKLTSPEIPKNKKIQTCPKMRLQTEDWESCTKS